MQWIYIQRKNLNSFYFLTPFRSEGWVVVAVYLETDMNETSESSNAKKKNWKKWPIADSDTDKLTNFVSFLRKLGPEPTKYKKMMTCNLLTCEGGNFARVSSGSVNAGLVNS